MNKDDDGVIGEEISFGGSSYFGYDALVRRGDLIALKGDNVATLERGMRVNLRGDSRGHVPGGFAHGETVEITGFREPFHGGNSDYIVEVTNGQIRGWIKPGNIVQPERPALTPTRAAPRAVEASKSGVVTQAAGADPAHLAILGGGVDRWNQWRQANPQVRPELSGSDLRKFAVRNINFEGANLAGIEAFDVDFYKANLRHADLRRAFLQSASLTRADLTEADLTGASLSYAGLLNATLTRAVLTDARLLYADLGGANLSGADLTGATLNMSRLFDVDLSNATLKNTSLMAALLVRVMLQGAKLINCRVHAAAIWKIQRDGATAQRNLIVSDLNDPTITTDDLEVAQFIHMLATSDLLGHVIGEMSGKAVLLLGRFTDAARMAVLNALADGLRQLGDIPIIFNFDKPPQRSVSETVRILAGLSKFIIADLTSPRSIPLETHLTVPDMAVPFFPIIQQGESQFSMFDDLRDYPWVLEGFEYRDEAHLVDNLDAIRQEALAKRDEIRLQRAQRRTEFRKHLSSSRKPLY